MAAPVRHVLHSHRAPDPNLTMWSDVMIAVIFALYIVASVAYVAV